MTWASNLEAPHTEPLRFARNSIEILHRAAEVLREIEPSPDYELEGFVFKLARGEGAAEGLVTVVGDIDGITRRVQMYLPARQYKRYELPDLSAIDEPFSIETSRVNSALTYVDRTLKHVQVQSAQFTYLDSGGYGLYPMQGLDLE